MPPTTPTDVAQVPNHADECNISAAELTETSSFSFQGSGANTMLRTVCVPLQAPIVIENGIQSNQKFFELNIVLILEINGTSTVSAALRHGGVGGLSGKNKAQTAVKVQMITQCFIVALKPNV